MRIADNQVQLWSRELESSQQDGSVLAEVEREVPAAAHDDGRRPEATTMPAARSGLIEIDLVSGSRLRVDASVDERALCRVLRALRQVG